MQRALLPDALPALPGLRFSAKYLPGGHGVKIGGDWYDVFQLANGRLGFVIGDVVGPRRARGGRDGRDPHGPARLPAGGAFALRGRCGC